MYTLYWCPYSGSLAPMAVLEEIGVAYQRVLIDINKGENRSPEYLKIQPLGLLPTIKLPGGSTVFESAGICVYLADRHSKYGLAPSIDDPDRGAYNQWMFFLADTIYPTYVRANHPDWYCTNASHESGISAVAKSQLNQQWLVLEESIMNHSWLVGEKFSAADIYLQMLASWEKDKNEFARMFPNVAKIADSTAKRPAVQRAVQFHAS